MNAQKRFNLKIKPEVVLADGPRETDGDGSYDYCVCFGDADGEPITENKACVWLLWDYEEVCQFVNQLAKQYGLEAVNESMPA